MACCQLADPEELATDPDAYDCATCRVRVELARLRPENRTAWQLYQQVVTRFTVETHAIGTVLTRVLQEMDPEDAVDLVARLSVIYDESMPIVVTKET